MPVCRIKNALEHTVPCRNFGLHWSTCKLTPIRTRKPNEWWDCVICDLLSKSGHLFLTTEIFHATYKINNWVGMACTEGLVNKYIFCRCKVSSFHGPWWCLSVEIGIIDIMIQVSFGMQVAKTLTYRVMCQFPLFVALCDHSPPTLQIYEMTVV